ncbi:MAG: glycoside hydrolase family 140 protein [bacterium]|nr:glycoside hydrolase family 140 protein [bacterium]
MHSVTVSPNQRFLADARGEPFFWLADTAWSLFQDLTLAEAQHYLDVRRQQGFNVIQAVILSENDALHIPNASGHLPLLGDDPARPNEYYFHHVDAVMRMALERGLYVGLLPTWGDKVYPGGWGIGPLIFNAANARLYGQFLGERYRDMPNILWILGGDRPAAGVEAVWDAMAEGITAGLGRQPFFTYHPNGGASSSDTLPAAPWLSMHMLQSGHVHQDAPNWEMIAADLARLPARPVLDGEPCYEDHPIDPFMRSWRADYGRFTDHDVRKAAYRAVFAGACGHTYGHHAVWQFWDYGRKPLNFPVPPWQEALLRPGAQQMVHLKNLMLSRSYFDRIPDQTLLLDVAVPPAPSAHDPNHFHPLRAAYPAATRSAEGEAAMVYFPLADQTLTVDLRGFGGVLSAAWFDPRTGKTHRLGEYPNTVTRFTSPLAGPDWVLLLDLD